MESPFEILGIGPDADEDDIQQAYRRRVMEAHPDHGGDADEFRTVIDAYEALQTDDPMAAFDGRADDGEYDDDSEEVEPDPRMDWPRVEFLDYDALVDNGWSLGDDDLFERAREADLDSETYGEFLVEPGESVLEAAESRGLSWPFACRGGACANCAVAVVEGEVEMPSNHVLSSEMVDNGVRLSCICTPTTDELKIVYNIKHLPGLDELRLPADRFEGRRVGR